MMKLLEAAALFSKMALEVKAAEHAALEKGGTIIEKESKRVIGTYDYGWPQLAPSTQADRERKGYAPNEPLLREGGLRDSIDHKVVGSSVFIGSNEDIAVYQELGTVKIPPRSFLGGAARAKGEDAALVVAEDVVVAGMLGRRTIP